MTIPLNIFTAEERLQYLSLRAGEIRLGEKITLLDPALLSTPSGTSSPEGELAAALATVRSCGARFAIVGIPEDIGPRANEGRGGAHEGWDAFLQAFLNAQANRFFDVSKALLLGAVEVADLQRQGIGASVADLRSIVAKLDQRALSVIQQIAQADLIPIVIGGGHNNAFPIIEGVVRGRGLSSLACINCDPHGDFRPLEGRHSGNGFRYAYQAGLLKEYGVLGLQESANSEQLLSALDEAECYYETFEAISIRNEVTFEQALQHTIEFVKQSGRPVGIELDLDAITDMPTSARSPYGFSVEEVCRYIHKSAGSLSPAYLHISEGAPGLSTDEGIRTVGRALSLCVQTFLKALTPED